MRTAIVVFTLLVAAPRLAAQDTRSPAATGRQVEQPTTLASGARVRVIASRAGRRIGSSYRRVTGSLVRLDGDSVAVREGDQVVAVPRASVMQFAVSDGTRSRGRGALHGAGIGAGVGVISGVILGAVTWSPCNGGFFCTSRSEDAILGGALFGIVGTAVGGAIGAVRGAESWHQVALTADTRVGVIATPRRVGLALRF